jgi:hypothetical protein
MPSRRQDLETRLVATDKASKVIEGVADELDKVDGREVEATVGVDDEATTEIRSISERLAALDDADKLIVLRAQAKDAERDIDRILRSLGRIDQMDDEEVRIRIDALGTARADLERVSDEIRRLDGETARVDVEADTSRFDSGLDRIGDRLDYLGVPLGAVTSALGSGGSVVGGVAAIAGALLAAANHAADLAVAARTTAELTGDSTEDASRLQAVWQTTGADVNDLNDLLLQLNGALESTPGLAEQIGVRLDDGATIGERFVDVVRRLADFNGTAAEKAQLMSQVFGEEGVRQVARLTTLVGDDLAPAMAEISDSQVFTDDEVDRAVEMQRAVAELTAEMQGLAVELGQSVIPALTQAVDLTQQLKIPEIFASGVGQVSTGLGEWTSGFARSREALRQIFEKDPVGKAVIDTQDLARYAIAAGREQAGLADKSAAAADALGRQSEATRDLYSSTEEGARNLGLLAEAQDEARTAAEEHIAALEEEARLAEEMAGGFQSLADLQRDLAAASEEQARLAKDQTATEEQRVEAALRIAELQVAQFEALKQAAGETATATEKLDAQNAALLKQAESAKGPVRDALLDYIATLNGIPPEKIARIETLLDEGKFTEAERRVRRLSQNREATVVYDADTTAADDARDRLAQPISTDMIINPRVGEIVRRQTGGTVPGGGEVALVGESGPELVALSGGSTVYTAGQTRRMLSGSTTVEPTQIVNLHSHVHAAVVGSPFDVMRAVDAANRRAARLMPKRP